MPAGVDEKEVEVFQREEKVGDVGHHNCRALERLVQLVKSSAVLRHAACGARALIRRERMNQTREMGKRHVQMAGLSL